jgi:hypothetical protein
MLITIIIIILIVIRSHFRSSVASIKLRYGTEGEAYRRAFSRTVWQSCL